MTLPKEYRTQTKLNAGSPMTLIRIGDGLMLIRIGEGRAFSSMLAR